MDSVPSINWAAMRTGHDGGSGKIIPSLIDQLRSTDPQIRSNASRILGYHLMAQGSLYEPAIFVIPLLIEMLRDDNFPDKFLALEVLDQLPGCVFDPASRELMVTEAFRANLDAAYEALYMNLTAGTDVFKSLLDSEELRTRRPALNLFDDVCPRTSESAKVFVERCKVEVDVNIRVRAIKSLGYLLVDDRFPRSEMAPFINFLKSLTTSEIAAVRTASQEALERCGQVGER